MTCFHSASGCVEESGPDPMAFGRIDDQRGRFGRLVLKLHTYMAWSLEDSQVPLSKIDARRLTFGGRLVQPSSLQGGIMSFSIRNLSFRIRIMSALMLG